MKKILLIEDNESVRENTAEILELTGYEVVTAENGKEGVAKAQAEPFDLVICDIMMPELDGYGVLHILNKNPKTSSLPFIFLTAKAERADFRKGMSLGADDYLTKPFEETELLNTIELRLNKADKLKVGSEPNSEDAERFLGYASEEATLEELITERNTRAFGKKDFIYREGEYPHALYYVIKGKVKLSRSSDYGKEFITKLCGPGDFLGYLALLENTTLTEDAVAIEDSEVAFISTEDFRKLIHSNREIANNFIKLLSKNALEQEERLLKLAYGNVRERVATILLNLHEKYAGESSGRIELQISREELAGFTGIATESLIRTLSDFRSEGIIAIEGKEISITVFEQVKKISMGRG